MANKRTFLSPTAGALIVCASLILASSIGAANAQADGDLRLFGNTTSSNNGRLEIYSTARASWGSVCDDNMSDEAAAVVCRQLGFSVAGGSWRTTSGSTEYGPEPTDPTGTSDGIYFDGFSCTGNETALTQCATSFPTSEDCGHGEDVVVTCEGTAGPAAPTPSPSPSPSPAPAPTPGAYNGALRLFNGTNSTNGRLEMWSTTQLRWGTVCDDNFDSDAAIVACRELGFTGAGPSYRSISDNTYGPPPSDTPVTGTFFDGFNCNGTETRLTQCATAFPTSEDCSHTEDIALFCTIGAPNPPPAQAPPAPPPVVPGANGQVRLFGGNATNGRVEMYSTVQQRWGTVCDDNFNDAAARVVCRQLGFSTSGATYRTVSSADQYGPPPSDEPVSGTFFDGFSCIGNETMLAQCADTFPTSEDCSHGEDVAVTCRPRPPPSTYTDGELRLFNGATNSTGRLEMFSAELGSWGTVCDDSFDANAAAVACRQLGFTNVIGYVTTPTADAYGDVPSDGYTDGIYFDGFSCIGNETALTECADTFPTNNDCNHGEDIILVCEPRGPSTPSVPLNRQLRCSVNYNLSPSTISLDLTDGGCSGTLPAAWSALTRLTSLYLHSTGINDNRIIGTLPEGWSNLRRLQQLRVISSRLTGTLPQSWSALGDLTTVHLGANYLAGTLPVAWSALTSLTSLELSLNRINGTLPESWSALGDLTEVQLDNNYLTGTLPVAWSALTRLTGLYLPNNVNINGTLPEGWSNLRRLQRLVFTDNRLTGTLPQSWSALGDLTLVNLTSNDLTGTLPVAWSTLTRLTSLDLGFNNINGTLPESWSALGDLTTVHLRRNYLAGTLPVSWSALEDLTEVLLDNNGLTGTLPVSWSALTELETYSLNGNNLTGTLPMAWSTLTALTSVALYENALTGPIPESWSNLFLLKYFEANNNKLNGPLPASWGALKALQIIHISDNMLSGTLPEYWGALWALRNIHISDNMLSGTLPEAWSRLSVVNDISVATNNLTGTLPEAWSNLMQLQYIELETNQLTGTLPEEWSRLSRLENLALSGNSFMGTLPVEWSRLSRLENLALSGNSFMGTLPVVWSTLSQATWLDLRSNNLTGTLPAEWGVWTGSGKEWGAWSVPSENELHQINLYNNIGLRGRVPQTWTNASNWVTYDIGCTAVDLHTSNDSSTLPRCSLNFTHYSHSVYPRCGQELCRNTPPLEQLLKCDVPYRLPPTTTVLDLTGGNCTGTLPTEWSSLVALQSLRLSSNNINGTLPPSWGALTNLTSLRLDSNHIGGPLPEDWSVLSRLTLLELSSNNITGTLPVQWSALGNASMVPLFNNPGLSGGIPQQWLSAGVTYDVGCTNLAISFNNTRCNLPPLDWPVCRTDGSCDGSLRLVGGNSTSGRLEVYSVARAAWGTVCENSFNKNAARVACRQLGFSDATTAVGYSTVLTPNTYGPPPARIFLDGLRCTGNEARLIQCAGSFPTSNTCNPDHSGDIVLYCQPL